MRLSDILSAERIFVDARGDAISGKSAALKRLSQLLAPVVGADAEVLERRLAEREQLQSTGIGDGVAIPHTSVESAHEQVAALLLCPRGVDFEAIDGEPVFLIFGVVGPRQATGDHLRALARISRLLRDAPTRQKLAGSESAPAALQLIASHEANIG